ncbi:luciferin 4-monooxygenase-like isoform X2 [Ostrinia nubilalis]|uniref:luciferin 4-monooxygenase-like isoform X2 n=2 Tax=Ostrinia nubilalis TaxID=29057 RepID=UPI00308248E5
MKIEDKFYHLGHVILECFRTRPDSICQIDAATGESETNASVLSRSIQLANSLRALGLVPGDVMALGGKKHLDLHIPYYAALFNGLPLVGVDCLFNNAEIESLFALTSPKIAFCDPEDYVNYVRAAQNLGLDTKIVTFGDGPRSMKTLVEEYPSETNEENFQLPEFDLNKVYIWLICTSGSTGTVKVAAFKHATWLRKALHYVQLIKPQEDVTQTAINVAPIQWVSGIFNPVGMPILHQTMVQTSVNLTVEHMIDIINKYRPIRDMSGPAIIHHVLNHEKPCDLSCFESIILGGAKAPKNLVVELRSRLRKGAIAVEMHGQTETMGPVLFPRPDTPVDSCGSPMSIYQVQIVDPDSETIITESNVPGELWVKGDIFAEYYNSPEETAMAFSKDGWFKTGDIFYRDERDNYYFCSRIKMLIKYQCYHVMPGELEDVIRSHPAVFDVAVTGAPHPVDGEHPVAFVVRRHGCTVSAQEIKDLVAGKLSEKKQLRGGVVFLQELPMTSNGKISLKKLKSILETVVRE